MIRAVSKYWNMDFCPEQDDVNKDNVGEIKRKFLGQNTAWLLKKNST